MTTGRDFPIIGVAGAGAWGTALANAAAVAGRRVILWGRDPDAMATMAAARTNDRHLPGVVLRPGVEPVADLSRLAEASAVLLVTPAQTTRDLAARIAECLAPATPLVLCAKGLERSSGRFLSEVVGEARPGAPLGILSGPSFAADVARGLPTAVTLGMAEEDGAAALAAALSGPTFRVYRTADRRGVEIGGAAKNVLAIACGAIAGLGLGESAKAALMARGFAELTRFAAAHGAEPQTLMGLSGLGDVVLTCSSAQSRNFAFGERLGRGASVAEAAAGQLVEGALTAGVLAALARTRRIEMPVAEAVAGIVAGRLSLQDAIAALMNRPLRAER
ncbi:MAG TPA: NAD(P)H-dependent glycerol-3-phosphate dehydrogenase [Beijerinckiaceae bacterium]